MAYFFLVLSDKKMSGNILWCCTWFFDSFCAIDKIISFRPKRSIETNFSKNRRFKSEIKIWPLFPRIIECDNPQRTIYKSPQAIFTLTVNIVEASFRDLRGCWKYKFLRNEGNLSCKKNLMTYSSRIIEYDKTQGTILRAPWGILAFSLEVIRSIF